MREITIFLAVLLVILFAGVIYSFVALLATYKYAFPQKEVKVCEICGGIIKRSPFIEVNDCYYHTDCLKRHMLEEDMTDEDFDEEEGFGYNNRSSDPLHLFTL